MNAETQIFNTIFEEDFLKECINKVKNIEWREYFRKLFFENLEYYRNTLGEVQFNEIINVIINYYINIKQIKYENVLLYEFFKNIPDVKGVLKTRIKSLNSIMDKKLIIKNNKPIYDIDAATLIITEYKGQNILKLREKEQTEIFEYIINEMNLFYSTIGFSSSEYGNNYIKNPKVGKVIDINVKEEYTYKLNSSEVPKYFSFHKCYKNSFENRFKEIHINTFETEKAIKGNTTLNHHIYKPLNDNDFLIFNVPFHLDISDKSVYEYNLIESFNSNFYFKTCFDDYLLKLKNKINLAS